MTCGVLNSAGLTFTPGLAVRNSSGGSFGVSSIILDADGNGFIVCLTTACAVRNSSGSSFTTGYVVLNGSATEFPVLTTVLASDGNAFVWCSGWTPSATVKKGGARKLVRRRPRNIQAVLEEDEMILKFVMDFTQRHL